MHSQHLKDGRRAFLKRAAGGVVSASTLSLLRKWPACWLMIEWT